LSFRFGWRRGLLPECDALLLWVFYHALPTGCVELLLVDGSIIVGIDLRKVHDVRSGVYSEYNVGPYRRSFRISGMIDQDKITAELSDGVITLVLPKAERAKPRRIAIG